MQGRWPQFLVEIKQKKGTCFMESKGKRKLTTTACVHVSCMRRRAECVCELLYIRMEMHAERILGGSESGAKLM